MAIETRDGEIFTGSYAENAAFNPSLPPLQAALNLMSLNGYAWADIKRVALAERDDATIVQHDATAATLKALGFTNLELVTLA